MTPGTGKKNIKLLFATLGVQAGKMADGVDIDLYADDLDQGFANKVSKCLIEIIFYCVFELN